MFQSSASSSSSLISVNEDDFDAELTGFYVNVFGSNSIEDLSIAYDRALMSEAKLIQKVAEQQTKLEEMQEQLVNAGAELISSEQIVQTLNSKLEQQYSRNSHLQDICNELKMKNDCLQSSLNELSFANSEKRESLLDLKKESKWAKEELNEQKRLSNIVINMKNQDIENIIGNHEKEVERVFWEGEKKFDSERADAEEMWRKINSLEQKLCDRKVLYEKKILRLSKKNGNLEKVVYEFQKKCKDLQEELELVLSMKIEAQINDGNDEVESYEEVISLHEDEVYNSYLMEISNEDHNNDGYDEKVETILDCDFPAYLYITAKVVKLHYPDMDNVSLEQLITVAKKWPWYLYHDRMMCFMLNQDFKRKNLNQNKPKKNISSVDSRNLNNFFKLFQNKFKMSSWTGDGESTRMSMTLPRMKKHCSLSYCFDEKVHSVSKVNHSKWRTRAAII